MPTPEGQDQVSCQAHVNEIIKTIIIHHETIFPDAKELDGPIYEKCMAGGDYWWGCQNLPLLLNKVPKNKLGDVPEIYTWVNNS